MGAVVILIIGILLLYVAIRGRGKDFVWKVVIGKEPPL